MLYERGFYKRLHIQVLEFNMQNLEQFISLDAIESFAFCLIDGVTIPLKSVLNLYFDT